jgi:biotin synthase
LNATLDPPESGDTTLRHDWTAAEAERLLALPLHDLLYRAHTVHRAHFDPAAVQRATLLNIKTGGCPEDCKYCAQSLSYEAGVPAEKLMAVDDVVAAARSAKTAGARRFCMGAAWRSPKDRDLDAVCEMVREVGALGLETCVTLGMLTDNQASALNEAGLDYYNHNLDTSEAFYADVVTTRTYQDRLDTLARVRSAGIKVCCGGILGLGESIADRASLLCTLAGLDPHPESVPINSLVRIEGTPFSGHEPVSEIDFVRTIAAARIMMPASVVRLAAGRLGMSESGQALALFAGANSIFQGERLLTTPNPDVASDDALRGQIGIA